MKIKTDSRKIQSGDTFVALPGINSNGDCYIEKAIQNGAEKIVCKSGNYAVETIHVESPRKYLVKTLHEQYGSIIKKMKLIAITGTNGKTTSAYLLTQALNKLGKKSAYIGTIGFYIGENKIRSLVNTTPDLCDLYELLLEAQSAGCNIVVLEASSQGLSYGRLDGLSFDFAIFTNLTQDHLDYHKTMENYALAKQRLFHMIKPDGYAIVNVDDSYASYFLLKQNQNITYGFTKGEYRISGVKMNMKETIFTYEHQQLKHTLHTHLIGTYNIYNLITIVIVLEQLSVSKEEIAKVIQQLKTPSGRMEMVPFDENLVIIDYAHTPDAMEKLFHTVEEFSEGNLYVVFGCTGSRDRVKRPIMASLATNHATYSIFTSDDLHEEEFSSIIDDMIDGLENTNYEICMDRQKAIFKGMSLLKKNDILLILGKGHEEFLVVKDQKIPFHDRTVVDTFILEKSKV